MASTSSQIRLINQALLLLGENLIQSLDEDTPEAKAADTFYPDARDHCLRDIKPSFAKRRSDELTVDTAPSFGWDQAHTLPQDCLLVLAVNLDDFGIDHQRQWRVEGRRILSNRSVQKIEYIAFDENIEGLMDASFMKALAAYLAYEMAYTLTNSSTKVEAMYNLYEQRADDARATYGMESSTVMTENTQLTRVR